MSPEDWKLVWGENELISVPTELLNNYPAKARDFLTNFGFHRRIDINGTELSFDSMLNPLEPYSPNEYDDLASQLIIGNVDFDGGAYLTCTLDVHSETISFLDDNRNDQLMFVNSDLALFAKSLLVAVQWNKAAEDGPEPTNDDIERLSSALRELDPPAFNDEKCFWYGTIEYEKHCTAR